MDLVVDNTFGVEAARNWLLAHKEETGLSLSKLEAVINTSSGTISRFLSGQYAGNNDNVAASIRAYRDRTAAQAEIGVTAPSTPEWYDTATSKRLTSLLQWAQSGKIVLIVTSPGIGKTVAAERMADRDPNVWLATMAPSTAGVATMAIEVGAAVGLGDIKGSPQQLSRQIMTHVRGRKGLIIIDEAQELTDKALNEIRGWHDRTKVGIALLGNEKVVGQLDSRKSALAQVSSRFSIRHVQSQPMPGDVATALDAWGIADSAQRAFLSRVGALPGALREMTQTLEVALVAAAGSGQALTLDHLREAGQRRNVKIGLV